MPVKPGQSEGPLLPPRPDVARVSEHNSAGQSASVLATQDHAVIRGWAGARQAQPATGEATSSGPSSDLHVVDGGAGLRFNFPGIASFRPIEWDEWLAHFDRHGLLFVFENDDRKRRGAELAGPSAAVSHRYRLVKADDWQGGL